MRLWLTLFCLLLILFAGLHSPPQISAGLSLGGFGDVVWNRTTSPGSSPGYTFTIAPNEGGDPNALWSFTVQLLIVSTPGAVGTLTVGDRSVPDTNQLFDAYELPFGPVTPVGDGSITFDVDKSNTSNQNVTELKNAVNLAFTSSADASGVFEIWARPAETEYIDESFTFYNFQNIPSAGGVALMSAPIGGGDVFMGSINVVPEPSSLAALGLVGCLVGLASYRRRMRARRSANHETAC